MHFGSTGTTVRCGRGGTCAQAVPERCERRRVGVRRAVPAQERAQVEQLAAAVQEATGETVELAFVDQGYTGEEPAADAQTHGIRLEVIKHTEAKRGFVLLPRRWVVERSFAWATRFRRLVRDYERLPETLAGLHFVAFACLMLTRLFLVLGPLQVHNSL